MGDPNAAPLPDPSGDAADRPDDASGEVGWTDEWAERQWNDIVADLTTPEDDGASGRAPRDASGPVDTARTISVAPWVNAPAPGSGHATGPRDWPTTPEVESLEDADSHFVPPEPEHVLGRDPLANIAWGLVALAPLLVIVTIIAVHPFPRLVGEIAGVGFLAGLATLVWRMPRDRDDDDGPGAVV